MQDINNNHKFKFYNNSKIVQHQGNIVQHQGTIVQNQWVHAYKAKWVHAYKAKWVHAYKAKWVHAYKASTTKLQNLFIDREKL